MQSVKLNLIPGAVLPVVNVSQYDVKRTFALAVYDGAASYDLTGKTVTIRGTKPDNHGFDYGTSDGVVSVSGNTVTISTTQQMTAVGGHVMAELRIESGTTVIGTLNFIIDVEPSALSDDTIISDTEIPVIERDFEAALAEAEADALVAEGYAKGTQDGVPVGSGSPYYHDNAKHYKEEAEAAASGVLEKYPKIVADYWYIWDVETNQYVNTGVRAKGTQGDPGEGVPAGGTTGQVLRKKSDDNYDTEWANGGGGASALDDLTDVDITSPASGQTLVFNSVTNKWENINSVADTMLPAKANTVLGAHNLFRHNGITETIGGALFTVNSDRSIAITTDGPISAFTEYVLCERYTPLSFLPDLKAGKEYIVNGSPEDSVYESHYWFIVFYNDNNVLVASINFYGTPTKFTMPAGATKFRAGIALQPGATLTNAVYKPMIRLASDPDDTYAPYAMTNRELTDVKDLSTFALSSTAYTLTSATVKQVGKIVQLSISVRTAAAITVGSDATGTISGVPLPFAAMQGITYSEGKAIGVLLNSIGALNFRALTANVAANKAMLASFIYIAQ